MQFLLRYTSSQPVLLFNSKPSDDKVCSDVELFIDKLQCTVGTHSTDENPLMMEWFFKETFEVLRSRKVINNEEEYKNKDSKIAVQPNIFNNIFPRSRPWRWVLLSSFAIKHYRLSKVSLLNPHWDELYF